jgi:hypothetical protein
MPGGKPVMARPGHTPRSPVTTVEPVLVAVEPARTAKFSAVPREGKPPPFACPTASTNEGPLGTARRAVRKIKILKYLSLNMVCYLPVVPLKSLCLITVPKYLGTLSTYAILVAPQQHRPGGGFFIPPVGGYVLTYTAIYPGTLN